MPSTKYRRQTVRCFDYNPKPVDSRSQWEDGVTLCAIDAKISLVSAVHGSSWEGTPKLKSLVRWLSFASLTIALAMLLISQGPGLSHAFGQPPEATAAQTSGSRDRPKGDSTKPPEPPKSERQLAEERKAREAARKRGEITFDDLKFNIEKGGQFKEEMITPEIKELDKKVVKLRGFILPTSVFQQSGIKQFVLVRDNQECCFGPGAALYDCVIVEMAAGKTATFSTRVVGVKGKLEIDSESFQYPDGGHYAIYKMTAEEVR